MEKNQKNLQNLLLYPSKSSSIKTAILIFFPLSIISFLLFCNHEFFQSFFNQFQSIKNSLNKKAMFCFFNAILLFLAKDFKFRTSSAKQPITAHRRGEDLAEPKGENQGLSSGKERVAEAKHVEKMEPELMEEEEVGGEIEEPGIDELNRKFEEFIERVKREMKMEALQKLVV